MHALTTLRVLIAGSWGRRGSRQCGDQEPGPAGPGPAADPRRSEGETPPGTPDNGGQAAPPAEVPDKGVDRVPDKGAAEECGPRTQRAPRVGAARVAKSVAAVAVPLLNGKAFGPTKGPLPDDMDDNDASLQSKKAVSTLSHLGRGIASRGSLRVR